jgi:hypothetical protein
VKEEVLSEDFVLPPAFQPGIAAAIAEAVASAWMEQA